MVRRQTWQARRFEIFESARHFRIESGRPIEFESNLEASHVPRRQLCLPLSLSESHLSRHPKAFLFQQALNGLAWFYFIIYFFSHLIIHFNVGLLFLFHTWCYSVCLVTTGHFV